MTENEFAEFAMALRTLYPKETILPNDNAMDMWFEMLKDIPYNVASAGLQKWCLTNKWSPAISDIRAFSVEVSQGDISDWSQGWSEVQSAVSRYGMYRPDEALESMSPVTREVVKRLGWTEICTSETPEVNRANFRMIYERESARAKQDAQIPDKVKNLIGEIQAKNSFTQIEKRDYDFDDIERKLMEAQDDSH